MSALASPTTPITPTKRPAVASTTSQSLEIGSSAVAIATTASTIARSAETPAAASPIAAIARRGATLTTTAADRGHQRHGHGEPLAASHGGS